MTRKELIGVVAIKCSVPNNQAAKIIDAAINTIKHELIVMHGEVDIPGFGTFKQTQYNARNVTNPRTGESMHIRKHKTPSFTAGEFFKKAVRQ